MIWRCSAVFLAAFSAAAVPACALNIEEALAEAARSRGCNVRSAYQANVGPANAAFLDAHFAGSPVPSPVFVVVCGEPVPPRIVFLGDIAGERQAAIRGEVASVVRFYAERFGVAVAESTLYVSPDGDAAAAAFRDLTGREYPVPGGGGTVTDTSEAGYWRSSAEVS